MPVKDPDINRSPSRTPGLSDSESRNLARVGGFVGIWLGYRKTA
jgi:hypothetical protein